jgi:hypothetical protein
VAYTARDSPQYSSLRQTLSPLAALAARQPSSPSPNLTMAAWQQLLYFSMTKLHCACQKSRWFRVWNPGPSLASSCRGCFEGIVPDLSAPGGSEPAVRGNAESSTPPSCSRSHTPLRPLSLPCSSAGIRTVPSPGAQSELCESPPILLQTSLRTPPPTPLPCIHLSSVQSRCTVCTRRPQLAPRTSARARVRRRWVRLLVNPPHAPPLPLVHPQRRRAYPTQRATSATSSVSHSKGHVRLV